MCTLYDCPSFGHSEAFVPFHEFAAVRSCFSSALSPSSSSLSSSPSSMSSSLPRHCLLTGSRSNWTRGRRESVSLSIIHPHPSLKASAKSIDIGFASFCLFFFPSRFFTERWPHPHPHASSRPCRACHLLLHPSTGDTSSASDDLTRDSACTIKCSTNGLIMLMAKVRLVILLSLMLFVPSNVTASADVSEIRNGTLFTVTSIRINTAETSASEANQLQGPSKLNWNKCNSSSASFPHDRSKRRPVRFALVPVRDSNTLYGKSSNSNGLRDQFHQSLMLQQQLQEQLSPSVCKFVFNSSSIMSGNFSSPGWMSGSYPPNVRCTYQFVGARYQVLNITFHTFQLETPFTKGCLKDYIDISTVTAFNVKRLIGRFCGRRVPSPIISMHPTAEIIFKSDHVITERGFFASFTFLDESSVGVPDSTISRVKGCGGVQQGSGGVIESPNFPAVFPNNIDCIWVIRVKQNQHIYINVLELQLFGSIANCKEAQLSIYDGYENYDFSPKEPKKFCGDLKYYKGVDDKVDLSSDNRLLIRFQADVSNTHWSEHLAGKDRVGFRMVWTAIDFTPKEECRGFLCESSEYCLQPRSVSGCSKDSRFFCIDPALVCDGVPNCSEQDFSDEDKCSLPLFIGLAGLSLICLAFIVGICYYCCYCRNKVRSSHNSHQSDCSMVHQNPSQLASVKGSLSDCNNSSPSIEASKAATVTLTNAGVDALSAAQLNPSPTTLAKLQQLHHHNQQLSQYHQFQHQILHDHQQQLLLHHLQPIQNSPVQVGPAVYQLYHSASSNTTDDSASKFIGYTSTTGGGGATTQEQLNDTFNSGTIKLIPKHMLVIDPSCPAHSTFVSSTLPRRRSNQVQVPTTGTPIPSLVTSALVASDAVAASLSHSPVSCQLPTLTCPLHQKQQQGTESDEQENLSQETATEDGSTEPPASSIAASVHSANETDAEITAAAAETASAFALYELMACKNVFY